MLAANSNQWAAMDLALLMEGVISVPLYYRQEPAELVWMLRDSGAAHVVCGDEELRKKLQGATPDLPPSSLIEEAFASPAIADDGDKWPLQSSESRIITLIYTSGTSGEAKGVMLTAGNVNHIVECTTARLDSVTRNWPKPERIFHYLPFSFAASWILLLSALTRNSILLLSTDLNRLPEEIKQASPQYFLNVPFAAGTDAETNRRAGGAARRNCGIALSESAQSKRGCSRRTSNPIGPGSVMDMPPPGISTHSQGHQSQPEDADLRIAPLATETQISSR